MLLRHVTLALVGATGLAVLGGPKAVAQNTDPVACAAPTPEAIVELFRRRHDAIRTAHPDRLLRLYAPNAVIETPLAATTLTMRDAQRSFFVDYLARDLDLTVQSRSTQATCDRATDRGTMTVVSRVNHRTTETTRYTATFELDYARTATGWLITRDATALALQVGEANPEPIGARPATPQVAGALIRAPETTPKPKPMAQPIKAAPSEPLAAPEPAPVLTKPLPPFDARPRGPQTNAARVAPERNTVDRPGAPRAVSTPRTTAPPSRKQFAPGPAAAAPSVPRNAPAARRAIKPRPIVPQNETRWITPRTPIRTAAASTVVQLEPVRWTMPVSMR